MALDTLQPECRLPTPRLGAWILGGIVASTLVACLVALLVPGAEPLSALLGGAAALAGACVGIALLMLFPGERAAAMWATLCLAGSATRLMASVTIAAGVYAGASPDRNSFWGAFLVASLIAIVLETRVVMNAGRALAPEGASA
jgi:F0F1-type ATP synthase assembly protein I